MSVQKGVQGRLRKMMSQASILFLDENKLMHAAAAALGLINHSYANNASLSHHFDVEKSGEICLLIKNETLSTINVYILNWNILNSDRAFWSIWCCIWIISDSTTNGKISKYGKLQNIRERNRIWVDNEDRLTINAGYTKLFTYSSELFFTGICNIHKITFSRVILWLLGKFISGMLRAL